MLSKVLEEILEGFGELGGYWEFRGSYIWLGS